MSLDITKVAQQVEEMVTRLKAGTRERQQRLDNALGLLHSTDMERLKRRILSAKTTWLVGTPIDSLDKHYGPLPPPAEFTVVAADGSHIDVDRHRCARCFLINIGSVVLHYGTQPEASLDSFPRLYTGDEELVIAPDGTRSREQAIEGALLGIKRSVDECQYLADTLSKLNCDCPTLALIDGSLILWGFEAYPEFVTDILLEKGFLVHLDKIKKLSRDKNIALASYISFPRSTDVVNALRIALCPNEIPDCDRDCQPDKKRDCDAVAGLQDRELFDNLLEEGERSAIFMSQSKVVSKHYGENSVYFFYLSVDDEIARVEIPQWVAKDEAKLNLVHSLVLDQCRRGQGYPVALSEAHEQAVVTNADKEYFWQVVESSLEGEHMPVAGSAKSRSKRTRWI